MDNALTSKWLYIVDMVTCRYRNNIGRHKMNLSNKVFPSENAVKIYPETCICSNFHFYGTCHHCE